MVSIHQVRALKDMVIILHWSLVVANNNYLKSLFIVIICGSTFLAGGCSFRDDGVDYHGGVINKGSREKSLDSRPINQTSPWATMLLEAIRDRNYKQISHFLEMGAVLQEENERIEGGVLLAEVLSRGNLVLAGRLVAAGADVNIRTTTLRSWSPFEALLHSYYQDNHFQELFALMLEMGANVDSIYPGIGYRPITVAILNGDAFSSYQLVSHGANVNVPSLRMSPVFNLQLSDATDDVRVELARILMSANPNLSLYDGDEFSLEESLRIGLSKEVFCEFYLYKNECQ